MMVAEPWYFDEVIHYLQRAVDQDGHEIDILVQKRKDKAAELRFFKHLLKAEKSTRPSQQIKVLREAANGLSTFRNEVIAAIDFLITGVKPRQKSP